MADTAHGVAHGVVLAAALILVVAAASSHSHADAAGNRDTPASASAGGVTASADGGASGGSVAFPGQFPWHAAVLEPQGGVLRGSGALVSQQFVLTAASALQDLAEVDVLLGALSPSNPDGQGKVLRSARLLRHERWDGTALNDIALVQTDVFVLLGSRIQPARLPPRYYRGATYVDQTLTASSWGYNDEANVGHWLGAYNVAVLRNRKCQGWQSGRLPWTEMCALSLESTPVPGERDNGCPVVFLEPDAIYTLVGIVSSDVQGSSRKPSTLARVSEYLEWIGKNSDAEIKG